MFKQHDESAASPAQANDGHLVDGWEFARTRGDGATIASENAYFLATLARHYGDAFEARTRTKLSADLFFAWEKRLIRDASANWVVIKKRSIPVRFCLEVYSPPKCPDASPIESLFEETNGLVALMFEVLRRTVDGRRNYRPSPSGDASRLLYWLRLQSLDILDQGTSQMRSGGEVPSFVSLDEPFHGYSDERESRGSDDTLIDRGHFPQLQHCEDPSALLERKQSIDRFLSSVAAQEGHIAAVIDALGSGLLSWCAREIMAGKSRQELLLARQWARTSRVRQATEAMVDQASFVFRERLRAHGLSHLALAISLLQEKPRQNFTDWAMPSDIAIEAEKSSLTNNELTHPSRIEKGDSK